VFKKCQVAFRLTLFACLVYCPFNREEKNGSKIHTSLAYTYTLRQITKDFIKAHQLQYLQIMMPVCRIRQEILIAKSNLWAEVSRYSSPVFTDVTLTTNEKITGRLVTEWYLTDVSKTSQTSLCIFGIKIDVGLSASVPSYSHIGCAECTHQGSD